MKRLIPSIVILLAALLSIAAQADKPRIVSQDQIPRFEYAFTGEVAEVATDEAVYRPLAERVAADLEALLADYDIVDETTRKDIQEVLLAIDLHSGRFDSALQRVDLIRELEAKPANQLTSGLLAESYVAARRAEPEDEAAFRRKFRQEYAARINGLPWPVVGDVIKQARAGAEIGSEALIVGSLNSQYQPGVDKTGTVSGEVAQTLVSARTTIAQWLPLRAERVAVLTEYVKSHETTKPDIWAGRDFQLDGRADLQPVVVAIWDSGIDMQVFPHQQWTNTGERLDGRDDDGNGFVDDVHGIAFDLRSEPSPDMLFPLTADQLAHYPEMRDLTKGMLDLQAGIDSDEAAAVRQRMAAMTAEEVQPFIENLSLFGNYTHGTHVAGIAASGNPAARLMVARISFEYRVIPMVPTLELAEKAAASHRAVVDYLKSHGVRVVNMSWGGSPRDYEEALEVNGAGGTPEERRKFARELFDLEKDALTEAIRSAPEMLFVVAAGNSDSDAVFDEDMPSSIDLPNVLTVGAVDQAGEETSFSSFGPNVDVHANGFEVESYIPGGERIRYSGTSMAAPNVTNLAAKLLALDPSLTTQEVVEIIEGGAERSDDGRINLINPRRSLGILESRVPAPEAKGAAGQGGS